MLAPPDGPNQFNSSDAFRPQVIGIHFACAPFSSSVAAYLPAPGGWRRRVLDVGRPSRTVVVQVASGLEVVSYVACKRTKKHTIRGNI